MDRQVAFHLMDTIRGRLDRSPRDRVTRGLERKLESLRFVVECWNAMPPSREQLAAMLDMLAALEEAAAR